MAELGEACRLAVAGIQVRRAVVGRKQNQRVQEVEHRALIRVLEAGELVALVLRVAPVAQDDLGEVDAAAVVSIRPGAPDAPQRRRQELCPNRPVVVPLVKVRAEIVALEVREDVLDQERLQGWTLQRRELGPVVDGREEGRGRREQPVEDAAYGIEGGFDVGDASVAIDLQIRLVAARAANVHEDAAPVARDRRLLTRAGLEVVQEVELEEVDDAGRECLPVDRGVSGPGGATRPCGSAGCSRGRAGSSELGWRRGAKGDGSGLIGPSRLSPPSTPASIPAAVSSSWPTTASWGLGAIPSFARCSAFPADWSPALG